jgi:hypothetical protein
MNPESSPEMISKRLSYRPIVITILALLFLSGGSFYGCAKSFNFNSPSSVWVGIFLWSFLVCSVACVGAVIWLIVAFFVNLARRARER